ncbi:hypothetical protein BUQ74_21000 [Leptospira weilii serovar Heyan]|nr:hypothetical protein BUQ74_21000 [Leptospira weilii serovar Heyan]
MRELQQIVILRTNNSKSRNFTLENSFSLALDFEFGAIPTIDLTSMDIWIYVEGIKEFSLFV